MLPLRAPENGRNFSKKKLEALRIMDNRWSRKLAKEIVCYE